MTAHHRVVTIGIRRLPEGVWLATSDMVPGLAVEADTREDAAALAPALARDLLDMMDPPAAEGVRFAVVFDPIAT